MALSIGFLIFAWALVPTLILYVGALSTGDEYWLDVIDRATYEPGVRYTLFASLILVLLARIQRPQALQVVTVSLHNKNFFFYSGLFSYVVKCWIDLTNGPVEVNLEPTRSYEIVLLGYVAQIYGVGSGVYCVQAIRKREYDKRLFILIVLFVIHSVLTHSRSGILFVFTFLLITRSYRLVLAQNVRFTSFRKIFIFVSTLITLVLGFTGSFYGDKSRGGGIDNIPDFAKKMSYRFYQNNTVLFLAIERSDDIRDLLLYNQPRGIYENVFSFVLERKHLSSSFTLPYIFGNDINTTGGHNVGHVYGWLGISYALGGSTKMGLFLLSLILFFFLYLLKKVHLLGDSLIGHLLFYWLSGMFMEFFCNLGIDSFFEKLGKNLFYLLAYLSVYKLSLFCFKKPLGKYKVSENTDNNLL